MEAEGSLYCMDDASRTGKSRTLSLSQRWIESRSEQSLSAVSQWRSVVSGTLHSLDVTAPSHPAAPTRALLSSAYSFKHISATEAASTS